MAMKITVKASDVWWYCQSHHDELTRDMHLIAENPEYGAEVYITDDMGFPTVMKEFARVLYGISDYHTNNRCIEMLDGTVVTPKVAIEWLKNEEAKSNE